MSLNKPENKPENEEDILIAYAIEGTIQFVSGWYDLGEKDYYKWDGDLLYAEDVVGWMHKPEIEF